MQAYSANADQIRLTKKIISKCTDPSPFSLSLLKIISKCTDPSPFNLSLSKNTILFVSTFLVNVSFLPLKGHKVNYNCSEMAGDASLTQLVVQQIN
jgi:hypothetical protein